MPGIKNHVVGLSAGRSSAGALRRRQVRLDRLPGTGQQPHGRRVLAVKHGLDPAKMHRGGGYDVVPGGGKCS